ncbi:WhiB family transcriptional regulator [Blastococcus sp. SYSU D00813]
MNARGQGRAAATTNDGAPLQAPFFDGTQVCRQVDPELFFPEPQNALRAAGVAKGLCGPCEFRDLCLQWALTAPEQYGIWAGTTEQERRKMRDRLGLPQPPQYRSAAQMEKAQRAQLVRELSAAGVHPAEIAARVGLSERHVLRIRHSAGIADDRVA